MDSRRVRREGGFTLMEAVVVVGVIAIGSAVAIPQMLGARRLIRSAGITRELVGGLRDARQMAISRRRAVTFQYDDETKRVRIIDHGTDEEGLGRSGAEILSEDKYPDTDGSTVATTVLLTEGGVSAEEIAYGAPPVAPASAETLGDKTKVAALADEKINLTFQPDGTLIGANGAPLNSALAVYNTEEPEATATAVSILGATGRIKAWRYSDSVSKYVE